MRAKLEAYNRVEVRFQGHIELAPSMPIQVCGDGCLRPLIVIDEAEDALSILTRTRMGLEHRQNPVIDTFRPPDQSGALELRALGVGFFTGTLPLLDVWTENPTKAGFDRLEWLTKIIRTRSDDLGTLDVEVDVDVAIIDPSIAGEGRAVVCICRREECPIDSIQQNVMDQSVRDSSYCLPAVRGAAGWRLDTAFLEAFQ
ncbi:hypothetical protein [Arenimonas composti]|uniref:hypothetical protein n=1 Tax=Arenimonas composti TaxID=370776 RepID=UPI0012B5B6FC|nr:hypothetical protein [Arenimonas composti]